MLIPLEWFAPAKKQNAAAEQQLAQRKAELDARVSIRRAREV